VGPVGDELALTRAAGDALACDIISAGWTLAFSLLRFQVSETMKELQEMALRSFVEFEIG
jgi:hypothetical protein